VHGTGNQTPVLDNVKGFITTKFRHLIGKYMTVNLYTKFSPHLYF